MARGPPVIGMSSLSVADGGVVVGVSGLLMDVRRLETFPVFITILGTEKARGRGVSW